MTDEQMRVAIAECCGLNPIKVPFSPNTVKSGHNGDWFTNEAAEYLIRTYPRCACPKVIPDYPNDLNAMHEAEKQLVLTMPRTSIPAFVCCNEASDYFRHLIKLCGGWNPIHATARQRCEAFLRTVGKWKEGK